MMNLVQSLLGSIQAGAGADRGRKLLEIRGSNPIAVFEDDLSAAAKRELEKLDDAAKKIEGQFVRDLLKEMMPKDFGGQGPMGDFNRDNFMNALAEVASKNGALGVAKLMKENVAQTIYRQEAARLILERQQDNQP